VAGLRHDAARDREYRLDAHWALYVENYLEGFHLPFVHATLAASVEYASYEDRLFSASRACKSRSRGRAEVAFEPMPRYGPARGGAVLVDLSEPDAQLLPVGDYRSTSCSPRASIGHACRFAATCATPALLDRGAGSRPRPREAEDEAVVQAVQRGVRSRFYRRGRYSRRVSAACTTSTACCAVSSQAARTKRDRSSRAARAKGDRANAHSGRRGPNRRFGPERPAHVLARLDVRAADQVEAVGPRPGRRRRAFP
jgi:hypothetical protein